MTSTLTPNADIVLGSSATIVYMADSGLQFVILKATVTNRDTAAHTVTCYRVPNSGAAGVTNIIAADALSVAAGATIVLPLSGQSLNNGQSIWALADTGSVVNFNMSLSQIS